MNELMNERIREGAFYTTLRKKIFSYSRYIGQIRQFAAVIILGKIDGRLRKIILDYTFGQSGFFF